MGWGKLKDKYTEALRLRKEERQSTGYIARVLKLSKGTISFWVKDFPLTLEERRKKAGYRILASELAMCKVCGLEFERTNRRKIYCSSHCQNKQKDRIRKSNAESVVTWRQRAKKRAVEYKGGKCINCGYCKCIRALKFHHIDSTKKDFTISAVSKAWDKLKAELDKCLLVCGNCHDEIHEGLLFVNDILGRKENQISALVADR